ncbi:efflux RND transporter periplasmic adaptor subunit [Zeimonas arvi]|uniref:Efflux RND transporter periplasmic adaptor subunit n=1 Tax=Zeimonas arvi TaxID=2498847 RepID=A0A5C8P020_9BURK|nr:efflux RND transporter periplasmic adaptor subunit [Zeimonas arvi]TXL66960.1 efflux RND transporter periplasmic adaptor subunit [Zeimonas arvi]
MPARLMPSCRLLALLLAASTAGSLSHAGLARAAEPPASSTSSASPRSSATPASLEVARFAAAGIQTAPVLSADAGWLGHLPARVTVPDAQLRFVAAPVSARVIAILVGTGDSVKAGQPLATLSSAELIGLRRDLVQASAERDRAARAFARDQALFSEGLIPASRVEASRAADRQAAALLAERRALLQLAGAAPGGSAELTVKSPIDGVLLSQQVRAGERVDPATTLFQVARLEPLALEIDVPVALAGGLAAGRAVRIPASGSEGRVIAVGRAVGVGQTIVVRAQLDTRLATLNPGQQVEAEIAVPPREGTRPAWRIPGSALVRLAGTDSRPVVFAERNGRYVVVPVELISGSDQERVVRGGLDAGDRVVSRGTSQLKAALGPGSGD